MPKGLDVQRKVVTNSHLVLLVHLHYNSCVNTCRNRQAGDERHLINTNLYDNATACCRSIGQSAAEDGYKNRKGISEVLADR